LSAGRFPRRVLTVVVAVLGGAACAARAPEPQPVAPAAASIPAPADAAAVATAMRLNALIDAAGPLLAAHPVNVARRAAGQDTADAIWFWSPGRRPTMPTLAERFGVIEAAQENGLLAFGNMSDQNELAPETVVTGPVWNMGPTVEFVINQVKAGAYTALDLKDFSMMGQGGASLADLHGFANTIDPALLDTVLTREQEIKDGLFRVDIDEAAPMNAVVPES